MSGKLSRVRRLVENQVHVERDIKLRHPNLTVVPLPATLKRDFEQLVVAYRPLLIKAAFHIVGNRETAEDIVQEALRKAYINLKLGRPYVMPKERLAPLAPKDSKAKIRKGNKGNKDIEDLEAWLHAIVRNVALNYRKSRQKRMDDEKKIGQLVEETIRKFESPEESVLRAEEAEELHHLVETLPPVYAAAIRLRFFHEYEYQAIADELHCPIGTIKSGVYRGLEMLGEAMCGQRVVKNGRMVKCRKVVAS